MHQDYINFVAVLCEKVLFGCLGIIIIHKSSLYLSSVLLYDVKWLEGPLSHILHFVGVSDIHVVFYCPFLCFIMCLSEEGQGQTCMFNSAVYFVIIISFANCCI